MQCYANEREREEESEGKKAKEQWNIIPATLSKLPDMCKMF